MFRIIGSRKGSITNRPRWFTTRGPTTTNRPQRSASRGPTTTNRPRRRDSETHGARRSSGDAATDDAAVRDGYDEKDMRTESAVHRGRNSRWEKAPRESDRYNRLLYLFNNRLQRQGIKKARDAITFHFEGIRKTQG